MIVVAKRKIQNGLLNNFKASFFSHALCTVKPMIIQHFIAYVHKNTHIFHLVLVYCPITCNWCGIQHHSSHPVNAIWRLGAFIRTYLLIPSYIVKFKSYITSIGFGSSVRTTPACSVILCRGWKNKGKKKV